METEAVEGVAQTMSAPDLEFVNVGRRLEVEAVDGGRSQSELTVDPNVSGTTTGEDEEEPVLLRSVDDAEERSEEEQAVEQFSEYAQQAYSQRDLIYPFAVGSAKNALEVIAGRKGDASAVADLARMVRFGGDIAKQFEKRAFRALWSLVGGWAVSVGAPHEAAGLGEEAAINKFRDLLYKCEAGEAWPETYGKNSDRGADGFIVLGRQWGGPLVFYQCKNTEANIEKVADELIQIPRILEDWFGRKYNQCRQIIRVVALNTILTLETKERIFENAGEGVGMHIVDAVDILGAEKHSAPLFGSRSSCTVF
jgi:hypothetical protein